MHDERAGGCHAAAARSGSGRDSDEVFEQRSAREIAAVLGIQEGHVRVRLNRARKRLYDMLREDAE